MVELPDDFELISEGEEFSRKDFQREIYNSDLVSSVFDILGYRDAIYLQSCFHGNEVNYLSWFMDERSCFEGKSPVDLAFEGKFQIANKFLNRLEHGVLG